MEFRRRNRRWLLGPVALFLAASPAVAQMATGSLGCDPGMLVFDASGSMKGTRIEQARSAAAKVLPALTERRSVGLITYGGHDRTEAAFDDRCGAIRMRLPPLPDAGPLIVAEIKELEPGGSTPLTEAVSVAVNTIRQVSAAGVVVLVTDGEENCGGDPCRLGRDISALGGRLAVHVIGFRLRIRAGDALACLARETRGTYVEVSSVRELEGALENTLGCLPISQERSHKFARIER